MPEQATSTPKGKVVWSGLVSVITGLPKLVESTACRPNTFARAFDADALRFARAEPIP